MRQISKPKPGEHPVAAMARVLRHLVREWNRPELHPQKVDLNWLRSPKPEDIAKMEAALAVLVPMLDVAKMVLAKAEAELGKRNA